MLATADIFLFEKFRLDRQGDGLSRHNERGVFVPVSVGLRALDVLGVLVERSGDLVAKEEIMAAVWGRTVVENAVRTKVCACSSTTAISRLHMICMWIWESAVLGLEIIKCSLAKSLTATAARFYVQPNRRRNPSAVPLAIAASAEVRRRLAPRPP